ncbi:GvpL/GvpF family gas vesicle protein [Patescibacteria group bacterium]|nr:GvpL/GvpF family gas vesicle protein [Patescibacteria group bacterium]
MGEVLQEGIYIYCIIEESQYQSFGTGAVGDRGDEVHTLCFNDIAAVVSNSPIKRYPVSRENLLPHERVIEEVMKEYTVLPVRFATITESEDKVKKILEREYDKFKDLLDKIKGKKELGVKAVFSAKGEPASGGKKDIYDHILEKYEDIKKLKTALVSKASQATYNQSVEIGKMVEAALEKEKESCKQDILNTLMPLAQKNKINDTYGERMIINAAFLVNEENEAAFDKAVDELDARYGDRVKFKYVGTLPPFNFVNLIIELGKY